MSTRITQTNFPKSAIFFASVLFLGAGCSPLPMLTPADVSSPAAVSSTAPLLTEEQYSLAVKAAIAAFIAVRDHVPSQFGPARAEVEKNAVRLAKEAVLAIVVPPSEKDAHLALARALAEIEQGLSANDQALWKKGENALDAFLTTYPWAK